ncbi:MAG: hypothetical protein NVSMB52_03250 [Chloroflexota bacterium]
MHSDDDSLQETKFPPTGNPDPDDTGMSILLASDASRPAEELRMLFTGFATGLSIAGLFLLYIIMETAKLLP